MQFWVDKVIPLTLHFASRGPRPSITRTPPTLAFALPLPPIPNIAHSYWHFNKQWLVDLITWAELYLSYSTYPTRLLTQAPGRKHAPFRSRPPLPSSPLSLTHTHTHTHTHTRFPPASLFQERTRHLSPRAVPARLTRKPQKELQRTGARKRVWREREIERVSCVWQRTLKGKPSNQCFPGGTTYGS